MDGESLGESLPEASARGRAPAKPIQELMIENEGEPKMNYPWQRPKCDRYFAKEEACQARNLCPASGCDKEWLKAQWATICGGVTLAHHPWRRLHAEVVPVKRWPATDLAASRRRRSGCWDAGLKQS